MLLKVNPLLAMPKANVYVPASKPETQRAVVIGALAQGKTIVHNDLRCSETAITKNAVVSIGAKVSEYADRLEIIGVDHAPINPGKVIDCSGSGFAFRTMSVLSSFIQGKVILTGDHTLRARIMKPLFDATSMLGAKIEYICEEGKAPVVVWGNNLQGGNCVVPGNTCSQFTTALLLGMPLAKQDVEIDVTGEIRSGSYIKQTIEAMQLAGVTLNVSEPAIHYKIKPAKYSAFETHISGDFTSASYLMAIAALFKGEMCLTNMTEKSFQGERIMVDVLKKLGLTIEFDERERKCFIINRHGKLEGKYEFNVENAPNILPTLAVIGAFVEGQFRVTGGSVTNHHKSPRIQAIATELKKLGVNINLLYQQEQLDGFEIEGKSSYEGGVEFSSWKDHRIFLSLFIASLKTKRPNKLDGYQDIHCSFPDFFKQVEKLGASFHEE